MACRERIGRWGVVAGAVALSGLAGPLAGQEKVTYEDHVKPIFREHCFSCHNQNDAKGGLALDLYGKLLEGGSSGAVVEGGDSGASRLFQLVTHADEPVMPPEQDKIADAKLATIKAWIDGGLLETSGSVAMAKKPLVSLGTMAVAANGPTPLPETVFVQSVVATDRTGAITAMAASPGAPFVAVAGQRQIVLTHTETGQTLGIIPFPEGQVESIRFTRNGAYLIVGGGVPGKAGFTALYDVKTGDRVFKLGDELDTALGADINNDLSRVALGGPQKLVKVLSTQTGEVLHELKKHTDWIYDVAFSPDGVLLATGDRSGGLIVWEAMNGQPYLDLRGHTAAVTAIAWRPDSNVVASASEDGTVRLWEMAEGKEIKKWNAHGGGVQAVRYNREGNLVTTGRDNKAKVWDGDGNVKREVALADIGLKAEISSDSQRIVTGDWAGQVKVWTVGDGKEQFVIDVNPPKIADRLAAIDAQLTAAPQAEAQAAQAVEAATKLAGDRAAELDAATKAVEASTAEQAALTKMVADERARLKSSEQAVKTARDAQAAAEKAMQAAKAAFDQKEKDLAAAETARKQQAERVRAMIVALAPETKDALPPADQVDALVAKLAEVVKATTAARDDAKTKAAAAEAAVKQAGEAKAAAEAELKAVAAVRDGKQQALGKLEPAAAEAVKLAQARTQAAQARDGAKTAFEQAAAKAGQAKAAAEKAAADVAKLTADVAAHEKRLTDLKNGLPGLQKAIEEAKKRRAEADADLPKKQAELEKARQALTRLKADREKLAGDQDAVAKRLAEAREKLTSFAQSEAELTKAVEAEAAKAAEAAKLAAERQAEMDRVAAELKAMQEKLAAAEKAKAESEAARQAAETAASAARQKLGELLSEKGLVAERATLLEAAYGTPQ